METPFLSKNDDHFGAKGVLQQRNCRMQSCRCSPPLAENRSALMVLSLHVQMLGCKVAMVLELL